MTQKQEVTQLQKVLEKERSALRLANDEVASLRTTLDSERSAVKALRRDFTNQIKKVKEEEAEKYAKLVDQFKERSTLEQEDALNKQKDQLYKTLKLEFQKFQHSREVDLHKEWSRKEEDLRHQLRDALNRINELNNKTNNCTSSVSPASSSSSNSKSNTQATSSVTNHNNELQACRAHNKQLELRLQELLEAERRNADKIRAQHEEHLMKESELQKVSRRETHVLLDKMKTKDRSIEMLEKEVIRLKGRLETICNNHPDSNKPGEPPRIGIKKRIANKTNGLPVGETARTRCDPIKETISNDPIDQHSCCENSNSSIQENDEMKKGPKENNLTETSKEVQTSKETSIPVLQNKDEIPITPTTESDVAINSWTKAVGLETLYQVVVAEHQELQRSYQALSAKLKAEQKARADLELSIQQNRSENPINLALAVQIQELTAREAELISENHDLREQNDLLEFRLLEIDSAPSSLHFKTPSSPSRSPESRGDREVDDISDSGVLSLPTSEDISEIDFHELAMEPSNRDIKSKLSQLCQTMENISDRICIQQGLALLRHYEARLEATLANMSPDLTKSISMQDIPTLSSDSPKSQSRIIATVLPFTDLSQTNGKQKEDIPVKKLLKDADCLQESGIFEESPEYCSRWTQTDWSPDKLDATPPGGDLSLEIRKLKQIRERIEEQGGNKRLLRFPGEEEPCQNPEIRELIFYRDRVELLENKLAVYESSGDEQIKRLNSRLEREIILSAQLKHLKERCKYLEELNRRLEEEKCEFEEAENDTRLRCQKLEVKLSALGEKKSDLQVQLQQHSRTLSNLKSCLAEEERKRIEARQHASQMESLVQCYEQRNFELEEKETEARWKAQMLEGSIPALIAYNKWKTASSILPNNNVSNHSKQRLPMLPSSGTSSQTSTSISMYKNNNSRCCSNVSISSKTDESCCMKCLENKITSDFKKIEENNKDLFNCKMSCEDENNLHVKIKLLSLEKDNLENVVKDFELKECYYKKTLEEADGIWASMEHEYKEQINQYERKLNEKIKELSNARELTKKLNLERDQKKRFQERVLSLESELKDLNHKLAEGEVQKRQHEKEEKGLYGELTATLDELNYLKNSVEPQLRKQIEEYKKTVKDLKKEIKNLEKEREQDIEDRHIEVSTLKRKINSLSKELLENECTIGELREEVQTLEIAVTELRDKYLEEQEFRERLIVKLTTEIEDKDREISLFNQKPMELPKSAKEELEEAEIREQLLHKQNSCKKRSKSQIKHKAKCHLTLKKLNDKIKAGLLVDDDFTSDIYNSASSSGEPLCEIIKNQLKSSAYSSSSEKYINKFSVDIVGNDIREETLSDIDSYSECFKDCKESIPLRQTKSNVSEDDPFVDCESTEVAASSLTSSNESTSRTEENIQDKKILNDDNIESASSNKRLTTTDTKHSTVSDPGLI